MWCVALHEIPSGFAASHHELIVGSCRVKMLPVLPRILIFSKSSQSAIHYIPQKRIAATINFNAVLFLSMLAALLASSRAGIPDSGHSTDWICWSACLNASRWYQQHSCSLNFSNSGSCWNGCVIVTLQNYTTEQCTCTAKCPIQLHTAVLNPAVFIELNAAKANVAFSSKSCWESTQMSSCLGGFECCSIENASQ